MKTLAHLILGLLVMACLGLVGCGGEEGDADGPAGGMAMGGGGGGDAPTTADVFNRLGPSCTQCHGPAAAANTAYFASEMAFVTLVVEPHVVPGDPDASKLVQLLEGTATGGTFTQMPLAQPFVNLPDTQISIAEIRSWVSSL